MSIRIIGTGSYTPEKVLTNQELEKTVDTTDEWITTRTGIKERRIAAKETATSDLALGAAKNALDAAGVKADELDLIVGATITQDKYFPSTSCILQKKLNAENAVCFDLHAACSGLLYSLEVTNSMMTTLPHYRTALVIGAEKLTSLVDWEDRGTCVLFGDGSGAIVLRRNDDKNDSNCILTSNLGAAGKYANILQVPAGGSAMPPSHETVDQKLHCMKMEGQEVFKLAVNAMVSSSRRALEDAGIKPEAVRWLVPHQANLRILKAVGTRLGIPEERVFVNVDKYGNTSAASIGIALDEICRNNLVKKDDILLLTAFGGGLTWGSVLLRW